jgi:hypothetical protein
VRFFGDRAWTRDPRAELASAAAALDAAGALPAGPLRHGALAAVLVHAGMLAQGLADAGTGGDGVAARATLDALEELAAAVWASWNAGGRVAAPGRTRLAAVAAAPLPDAISMRRPEGFALYAVYPEAHAAAARAVAGQGATVIGIRSIGTTLAAMVAAGAGDTRVAGTVRPTGHPFRREATLGAALEAAVLRGRGRPFAVADEGPGLSGSSFAAVLRALRALGVPPAEVHLFPSHAGEPGPEAAPDVRALYGAAPRHHVAFESLLCANGHPLSIPRLAEDAIGPPEAPPEDVSAGAWRAHAFGAASEWPPSQGWRERRKYLLRAGGCTWLVRFAGLGDDGARALARARALAAAGLAPAPAALRHGFVFTPWLADARPLARDGLPRPALLAALRRHLAFVAATFPAAPGEGAAPAALLALARDNAREALGPDGAAAVERVARMLPEVEGTARPVAVDGKLDAWEWLLLPDGRVQKADALDHHADHGLAGCQDALWDVAGAELAFGLPPEDGDALARAVRAAAPGAPPRVLPFYRVCQAAFETARWALAAGDPGLDAAEAARRASARDRAVAALRRALAGG